MTTMNEKYAEGHFVGLGVGIGVAMGSGLGVAFALIIGNMAFMGVGIPIGVAVGIAIGTSMEAKCKQEGRIRPLSPAEQQQKKAIWIALGLVLLGFIVLLAVFLLR